VPEKIIFARSGSPAPAATGSAFFSTGALSPVNAASAVCKDTDWSTRASAAIFAPSSMIRRSPGTTSAAGTLARTPSRMTRASAASSPSVPRPRARALFLREAEDALATTIASIASASYGACPGSSNHHTPSEIADAASSSRTSGLLNWASRRSQGGTRERTAVRCDPSVQAATAPPYRKGLARIGSEPSEYLTLRQCVGILYCASWCHRPKFTRPRARTLMYIKPACLRASCEAGCSSGLFDLDQYG